MEVNKVSVEAIREYLVKNFLTLHQLARASGMSEARVRSLIEQECVPGPSYILRSATHISSSLHDQPEEYKGPVEEFFSPSVTFWIAASEQAVPTGSLSEAMYQRFEVEFFAALIRRSAGDHGFADLFDDKGRLNQTRAKASARAVWRDLLKGTYGICIKGPVTADSVVRKAIAVHRVASLTNNGMALEIEPSRRETLVAALREFDDVVSHFAPHDWARSSRKRLFDDLLLRYGLQREFPRCR